MLPDTESPLTELAPRSSLRESLRLLTLRPAGGSAVAGNATSIVVPVLLAFALWAGFDWIDNLPEARFFPYGLPGLAWYVLAALLAALGLTLISRPALSFARACSLLALLAPVLVIAQFGIERLVPEQWAEQARSTPPLPGATSLRDAFDKAKVLIAEREKQEGVEASLPQAYFGEQMEEQLAAMSGEGN